jgi:hypothetical protein
MISKRQGGERLQWNIGADPQWAKRCVRTVLDAHESYALRNN